MRGESSRIGPLSPDETPCCPLIDMVSIVELTDIGKATRLGEH